MKKLLFIIFIITSVFISSAEEERVPIEIFKGKIDPSTEGRERAPKRNLIEAYYDKDTHVISVIGVEGIVAEVYLYNSIGMLVDYSSEINVVFTVITPGDYTISIVSEDWSGVGIITIED
ncbi:MAG: hypothetical protein HDS69_06220 [Bacteroidales bacterium]|nr:hypothetical protein [Bacteroidales bacterium]